MKLRSIVGAWGSWGWFWFWFGEVILGVLLGVLSGRLLPVDVCEKISPLVGIKEIASSLLSDGVVHETRR